MDGMESERFMRTKVGVHKAGATMYQEWMSIVKGEQIWVHDTSMEQDYCGFQEDGKLVGK